MTSVARVRADGDGSAVAPGVRIAAAWSWRSLVIAALVVVVVLLLGRLAEVTIPLVLAVLLTGLLTPLRRRLDRGLPHIAAVLITFLGLLVAVAGLLTLVVLTVRAGSAGFQSHLLSGYRQLLAALQGPPFNLTTSTIDGAVTSAEDALRANSGKVLTGALTGADFLAHFLIGLVLTLFITLFLLLDGAGIWRWCTGLAPRRARAALDGAGRAAWLSIGQYARIQVVVALVDGLGVGIIAALLHVPFAVPIGVLVFLGAFIPIVGSVTAGALAVVVALIYNGPVNAVAMLAGVLVVNQVEAHVLHPLLMGSAVRLHPIAVVLAVATGSLLAGIVGALFAVPLTAATNSAVKYLAGGSWRERPQPSTEPPPTDGDPSPDRDDDPSPSEVTTTA